MHHAFSNITEPFQDGSEWVGRQEEGLDRNRNLERRQQMAR